MTKKFTYLLTTFLTLNAVSATSSSAANQSGNNMIKLDETRSYCIGRYVVDIPAEAYQFSDSQDYDSFIIDVQKNAKKEDFYAEIKKVQTDYSQFKRSITEDLPEKIINGRLTKVIKGKKSRDIDGPYSVYGFILDQGHLFKIRGGYSALPEFEAKSNESMKHLIESLNYRHENEIPKENGQCIANGFIKDNDKKYRHNEQTMAFKFINFPTVIIRFNADSLYEPHELLIPRTKAELNTVIGATLLASRNTIRKGEKNTSYLSGQEWISVERMKGRNGISGIWEHRGQLQDNKDPTIYVEVNTAFDNANRIRTSDLSKQQALQLYEKIINSIRPLGDK